MKETSPHATPTSETPPEVTPERTEQAIAEFKPNPSFVAASAMIPQNYKEVMELGTIMCKSNLVPKEMIGRPEACAVAIMFGLEVGLTPTQSMQNIMVVNGRPSIWGDALKALVVGSGKCEVFDEDPPHVALAQGFGRCRLKRKDGPEPREIEIIFSVEDAKKAKLWTKQGPWQDYPGRMLMYRARSWAARDKFPDVLKGMQMREEVQDYEIIEPRPQVPMPQKRAQAGVGSATVVDATIVPTEPPIVQPPLNAEASREANDAQAPGDAAQDQDLKITEERRKELFKLWTEAKVDLADIKAWCKEKGVPSTSELTWGQAGELEAWIASKKK